VGPHFSLFNPFMKSCKIFPETNWAVSSDCLQLNFPNITALFLDQRVNTSGYMPRISRCGSEGDPWSCRAGTCPRSGYVLPSHLMVHIFRTWGRCRELYDPTLTVRWRRWLLGCNFMVIEAEKEDCQLWDREVVGQDMRNISGDWNRHTTLGTMQSILR
jgi:hypothetical protein